MLVQSLCIPKHQCVKISETATLREALQTLEETGYRCVPVLDQTGQLFKGNIYKMHIYRHGMNGGSLDDNVMTLIKNTTKFIYTGSNFFEVFFSIKELPYIAVLNDDGQFFGILPHGKMLGMLEEAWNRDSGSYVLTVALSEQKGALEKIAKIINKYSTVASLMTLDAKSSVMRRVLITLPTDCDEKTKKKIVKKLNEKGLRVVAVEDLAVRV
ncbi:MULTISPECIES: cyclic di-AMP binding protein CbpA [Exiguobacterium]|uniref:CBS domain containing protein n=1 Tax=Exiguobacterium sibiricum (strain DSM 17290 / CCUG 55495 / CIP 109462 / JCM 13490 / 255-15) TaxID=262543 RepID=B1YFM0_EXIS2|nr:MULTISPECIES: cyclic di-AMP binding protein CbpA [Exiguobacterium]ACB62345.1 CBS domain containing protein [Exiguobacterium sibiricum 255-15]MCT4792400.1 cyclic di-AMP binding protein CbpA [Exiguobacterium artemiae]MDW2885091.1 cyclic di-AMP binding protein CbpA [Exiguobacterium sibiricum]MDX1260224.1 cyclic di-AMP binding protein CbpA [Exiguobacterium sp. K1]HCN57613.1 CBS domain-containing protein [Exiguobacterium sp.]